LLLYVFNSLVLKIVAPFLLLTLCFAACKKEQPGMDPTHQCDCAKEVSADFKMGEKYGESFIELDTIAMPVYYADGNPSNFGYQNTVYVYFSADVKNAISYEWQVGNNSTVQTVKDFGLYFNDTIGTIPVRLIVHAQPNLICYPDDDGIDTVVKYLTIRTVLPDPLAGKYYGYNTNDPGNYFTIEIDTVTEFISFMNPPNVCGLAIRNLPEGKHTWTFLIDELGSTTLSFTRAGSPDQPYSGDFVLYDESSLFTQSTNGLFNPATNEIRIHYYSAPVIDQFTLGTPFPKRTFIGQKIP